jgi:hypothetical protein
MKNLGITPHLFISSLEVMVAYAISSFIFLKLRFLEIVNQINYYEESLYVTGILIITPFFLGVMHIFYVLYKEKILELKYLVASYFIILLSWIGIYIIVTERLIEEYGTEHFFSNYCYYILGLVIIYTSIDIMHKLLEYFIKHIKKEYVFSWDEIPGKDNGRLIDFLARKFELSWIKNAKLDKIDIGKTIKVYTEKNSLLLMLNNKKTEVKIEIDDGRTDRLIAEMGKDKINIYKKI